MAVRGLTQEPPKDQDEGSSADASGGPPPVGGSLERYRPLPTGSHGLDPDAVERDQRQRLLSAMTELIAEKGYPAVRIVDLAKLAHVSQPTLYNLYTDKEGLFLSAYEEIFARTARTIMKAYEIDGPPEGRLLVAMRAFAELAAAEPAAISLMMLGGFGAGAKVLERRRRAHHDLETRIRESLDRAPVKGEEDLTVKVILGGIREVTVARLLGGREAELPALTDQLAAWAACYPRRQPAGLAAPSSTQGESCAPATPPSERARRAEGRLPSGRSDLPRQAIEKSQRERIVDATAAIVAEKGLAALTIPEIARRANVSNQTFYAIYKSKHDAYLGTQKVGMHQAFGVAVAAYETQLPDWPAGIAAGLRALIDYLVSEPAHAHLSIVDTFGTSPETMENRDEILRGFASYFATGYELAPAGLEVPAVAAEAVVGGVWQVLHHYIENERIADLPDAAPQLTYLLLTPFLGPGTAARAASA